MPVVHLRVGHDTTSLPGIALLATGFLGVLWGNPAWFAWVPLLLANRARRAGRSGEVVENTGLFAAMALFVLAIPWTVSRPIWGSTTSWTVGPASGRYTQTFFDVRASHLSLGAWLLAFAACMTVIHIVTTERATLRVERSSVLRGVVKYAAIVSATLLMRAAVMSESANYHHTASVPGSAFLLTGFFGPFVGHFGWLANLACATAWWGVLAARPTFVRFGARATSAAWLSCGSLFVWAMPGNEGLSLEHPSLGIGFVYWTLFLGLPFAVDALLGTKRLHVQ